MSLAGIPGQIALGQLSDRIGREWVWTVGCVGFALCYLSLLLLRESPTAPLLYFMVVSQGALGIRSHLRRRRHPGRDLSGPALRLHLRHADAGRDRRAAQPARG